ncbi:MAG: 2Fe-2S iron-sulfur cluster-binding protein [Synechococcus sp.]
MSSSIYFILNDRDVATAEFPGVTVLDFLRLTERMTGMKEGCREGGCGACAVLLGNLGPAGIETCSMSCYPLNLWKIAD